MGMYTEIYVNVDLKKDTSGEIIKTLKKMCDIDYEWLEGKGFPVRWGLLFNNGSYYTPYTSCANITYDEIGGNWSLIGKGDIKNYDDEIEQFFDWIKPHVKTHDEKTFMGYMRYEADTEPTLVYA